jgi:hypothetical protein
MALVKIAPNKNASGQLGPICSNCAGYGYTLGISGKDHGCHFCNQTGVSHPSNQDLQQRVASLEAEISGLKNVILQEIRRTK